MEKKLSEITDKELAQQKITFVNVTGIMAILIFLMVIIGVYSYIKKGEFNFTQIMALFFIPLLFTFYWKLKTIKDEIKTRNNKS